MKDTSESNIEILGFSLAIANISRASGRLDHAEMLYKQALDFPYFVADEAVYPSGIVGPKNPLIHPQ